jgi:hypothetical protein
MASAAPSSPAGCCKGATVVKSHDAGVGFYLATNGRSGRTVWCVSRRVQPCLDQAHKPCKSKKKHHNEVYLQNFLYVWAVNRETNLMSLLNS